MRALAALSVLAIIPAAFLSFELVLAPWGQEQLARADPVDTSCANCRGINSVFPVTTGSSRFSALEALLINNGGKVASALALASVAVAGTAFLVSLVWLVAAAPSSDSTVAAIIPSPASSSSSSVGCWEALLVIAHGQFITLLGALNLRGAPLFFFDFCKHFVWTNVQLFPSETSSTRAQFDTAGSSDGDSGVYRYAQLVGAKPEHLFYYTCVGACVDRLCEVSRSNGLQGLTGPLTAVVGTCLV